MRATSRSKCGPIAVDALAVVAVAIAAVLTPPPAEAAQNPELVSVGTDGKPVTDDVATPRAISVSEDGNVVGFSVANHDEPSLYYADAYRRDRSAGTTKPVLHAESPGGGANQQLDLSATGRYFGFVNYSDEPSMGIEDTSTGTTKQTDIWDSRGYPSISDDGGKFVFDGYHGGSNGYAYTDAFLESWSTGKTRQVTTEGSVTNTVISGDGTKLAYRYKGHAYIRELASGKVTKVDVTAGGAAANTANARPVKFSDNGKWLLFTSTATNLAPGTAACTKGLGCAFRRNVGEQKNTVASVLPGGRIVPVYQGAAMSDDGRVAAFDSDATGTPQVYSRRLSTATTKLSSVSGSGAPADHSADHPVLDGDGGQVAFRSAAGNFGATSGGVVQAWITATGV